MKFIRMNSFIYGHIHPCRWIKIILSFKLQAQSSEFRFYIHTQTILHLQPQKDSPSSTLCWQWKRAKLSCPYVPRSTKKEKKKRVHAYFGVVNVAFAISNARAQAPSSLGSLLLKVVLQALQAHHSSSSPSSKLSKCKLNRKPQPGGV
jgi:hypothetical protein